ncbi:alpha/beta fold hydrolase [Devosia sp. WQ 349]|uniref:alpha/beta hydrolase n=1 Tax=Devosia sp. WQ 349K1 TaxID=2800329 RepID=UPI0019048B59|nr:alpha/beta fold hydrolase [Devosia sp. WQ 349K1]MBK1794172.1 alpha/beta fold hydrolase [Devosia sp. WQ 349K1]
MTSESFLQTQRHGPETAPLWFVFHDRWQMLEDAVTVAERLGPDALAVSVRAPRAQSRGGTGQVMGYFWAVGPQDYPELSTLGDGLYQLELLLDENLQRYGRTKLNLLGYGEGGMVALTLAAIFPDKVEAVIVKDAYLPLNIDAMPIRASLAGVQVALELSEAVSHERVQTLVDLGANVTTQVAQKS